MTDLSDSMLNFLAVLGLAGLLVPRIGFALIFILTCWELISRHGWQWTFMP